jgi:mannose-6-phosphate isomerase-like protein (cupin superfamily)
VRVEKSWGYEEIIHNGDYCCKKLVYTRQIASSLHYHNKKHECFVVCAGRFTLEIGDEFREIGPGDTVVIPSGTKHRLGYLGGGWDFGRMGVISEASSHDDPEDCVRLVPSET